MVLNQVFLDKHPAIERVSDRIGGDDSKVLSPAGFPPRTLATFFYVLFVFYGFEVGFSRRKLKKQYSLRHVSRNTEGRGPACPARWEWRGFQ